MKNTSISGFPQVNPTYLTSRSEKYRNIYLVSTRDAGYLASKKQIIDSKRAKRTTDYVPGEVTALQNISGDIEHVVRNSFFSSEAYRIVEYEVRIEGKYLKLYHELDGVRVENDGSITLVEIKATSNINTLKALNQLNRSADILRTKYKKLNLVVINVDMASLTEQSDILTGPVLNQDTYKVTDDGVGYYSFVLSPDDIRQLSTGNEYFKHYVFEEACVEAMLCATQRRIKNQEKFQRKIAQMEAKENEPSEFAILLQASIAQSNLKHRLAIIA